MEYVAGVGLVNIDILYSGMSRLPNEGEEIYSKGFDIQLGGGVSATLINLSRLGVPAKLCTYLGDDMLSNFAREQLKKYKIQHDNLYEEKGMPLTVTSIMITERDRTFASYQNRPNITKEVNNKIYQKLKGAKIVEMYTGYLDVYRRLKAEGTKLVFDIGWDDEMSLDKYREYLELADYFTPNQKEALKITHSSNVKEAASKLSEFFETVIIKLDKDGCLVVKNGNHHIIPPLPDINAIDSTGAGDAFLSGFLYGIYHDYPLEDGIKFGNITGGTCVQGIGCLTNYVTEKELLEIANKVYK